MCVCVCVPVVCVCVHARACVPPHTLIHIPSLDILWVFCLYHKSNFEYLPGHRVDGRLQTVRLDYHSVYLFLPLLKQMASFICNCFLGNSFSVHINTIFRVQIGCKKLLLIQRFHKYSPKKFERLEPPRNEPHQSPMKLPRSEETK